MNPDHTNLTLHEGTFHAFGSSCRIVSDISDGVRRAALRLEDLESRWSRFIPTSEISALNAASGEWYSVSAITTELIMRAEVARQRTKGRFNALMHDQLVDHGYDRSFELLESSGHQPVARPASTAPVELSGAEVRLPMGCGFDPGGLGKGFAADLVRADLLEAGAQWVVVSLGGDIAFGGEAIREHTQEVLVDDPRSPGGVFATTRVAGGALATSTVVGRQWQRGEVVIHHLLDPRSGTSVDTSGPAARIGASVYASAAWWADVVAKVLVIDPTIGSEQVAAWECEALGFTHSSVDDLGLGFNTFAGAEQ